MQVFRDWQVRAVLHGELVGGSLCKGVSSCALGGQPSGWLACGMAYLNTETESWEIWREFGNFLVDFE